MHTLQQTQIETVTSIEKIVTNNAARIIVELDVIVDVAIGDDDAAVVCERRVVDDDDDGGVVVLDDVAAA